MPFERPVHPAAVRASKKFVDDKVFRAKIQTIVEVIQQDADLRMTDESLSFLILAAAMGATWNPLIEEFR